MRVPRSLAFFCLGEPQDVITGMESLGDHAGLQISELSLLQFFMWPASRHKNCNAVDLR